MTGTGSILARVEADMAAGLVRLCFGGRKLWRGQYNLEANGYGSHEEWLAGWRDARDGEFFVLGSRDESGGCQLCVAAIADDGSLTLRLRMPDCLAGQHGKYVVIEGVKFATATARCWRPCRPTWSSRSAGAGTAKGLPGQRFWVRQYRTASSGMRRDGGCSSPLTCPVPVVTDQRRGAIGVDLNAGHLAVTETDSSGNWLRSWRVPLVTYGRSSHRADALIGDSVAGVVEHARQAGKPVVIERLDFKRKKAALEGESRRYSRMLSSFSYGKIKAYFIYRGYR